MINTLTDIANFALAIIGEESIENVEANDTTANRIRRILFQVIDEVCTSYRWSEITGRAELYPDSTRDIDGNTVYPLPADCLRVLDVYSGYTPGTNDEILHTSNHPLEYTLEGNNVLLGCNTNKYINSNSLEQPRPIKILMIRASSLPHEWGTLLTECIYHKLAIKLAHKITGNKSLTQSLIQEFAQVIEPKAKRLQSYQNNSPVTQHRKKYSRIRGARH